jgi:hypothetical protein
VLRSMIYRLRRLRSAGLCALVSACSVTRPVPVATDAVSLKSYLADRPVANLRITDRAGRRYWVHAPQIRGDSLVGRQGYDVPARPLGVGLDQVVELHTGHFSLGRTGAVVGGVLAVGFVALGLVVEDAQPLD